jgi:hypothetical protein
MQLLFSGAIPSPKEVRGVTAVLGILDAESGELLHLCEYRTPPELQAPKQKMQFTGFSLHQGSLHVCSHTEITRFDDWPPTTPAARISLPGFNDLHHCIPWEGGLAVANTGLETVDHVSLEGQLIHRWDLLEGDPEARRIDPELDYRRIPDTKPHRLHPNHLWVREGELWATGLKAPGAVCVTGERRRITFDTGRPHDGRLIGGRLAFTTVRGYVVLVDPDSLQVVATHDLEPMTPGIKTLGWCRGLCEDPRDPNRYFVAFSSLRESPWREYGFRFKHGHPRAPSRIALYDVESRQVVKSFTPAAIQSLVLFQLDALPEALWIDGHRRRMRPRREAVARRAVAERPRALVH